MSEGRDGATVPGLVDRPLGDGTALQPCELLVLQLLARGYSRAQVAALLGLPAALIGEIERSACAALGVATLEEAVELARRCRLIV